MQVNNEVKSFLESQERVTLGFSTGKDSLACAILLKNMEIDFIPFLIYHIPDLDFVEKNLKMYEDKLQKKIIKLPHPMLYDYLRHQDFMQPKMIEYLFKIDIPHLDFNDLIGCYLESINLKQDLYDVVGQRADESFNRRMVFKKLCLPLQSKWFEMTKAGIKSIFLLKLCL